MVTSKLLRIALGSLPIVFAFSASQAVAAILEADLNSNLEAGFDGNILNNDLIEGTSPALASLTATPGANFPATGSNDGTATHVNGLVYYGGPPPTGVDLLYTLQGSATGYDINTVNSIYGWQDSRYRHAAQEWTISVSTVANPTLTPLYTVVYAPYAANDNAAGSTQVTLTDSTGTIVSGVTAINFHLTTYGNPGDPGYTGEIGVVREFDVLGTPTVPEPASLGLIGLGGLGILARRRRV